MPLQRIDCEAIALFVLTTRESAKAADAGDLKTAARLGRDALVWAAAIGATPQSRARMSVKPAKPIEDDPWAVFDESEPNFWIVPKQNDGKMSGRSCSGFAEQPSRRLIADRTPQRYYDIGTPERLRVSEQLFSR